MKQTDVNLPLPQFTYYNFVKAQTEFIHSEKANQALQYWKEQLAGELPLLDLPASYRGEEFQGHQGSTFHFCVSKESMAQLKRFSQTENVTLYTLFLAVFQVLLHRYSGQDDILVGAPVSERDDFRYHAIVGHFINPISIRGNFTDDPTFRSLLNQIKNTMLAGLHHKEYPFPLIVKHVNQNRQAGYSRVFQAVMVMQKIPETQAIGKLFLFGRQERIEWTQGLSMESFDFPEQEGQFDLVLELREAQEGIFCALKYNRDLFEHATIVRMSSHFKCLVSAAVSVPEKPVSKLALLTQEEKSELLGLANDPGGHFVNDKCIHQLFEEQVTKTPKTVALTFEGNHLSYEQLNLRL